MKPTSPPKSRQLLTDRRAGRATIDGIDTLVLGSNDYLGLSTAPEVVEAATRELKTYGTGMGIYPRHASTPLHDALCEELAEYLGVEAVAIFSSGSSANAGVLSTLVGKGDAIVSDRLNHASIIDGCRLSRANVLTYESCDVASLASALETTTEASSRLIITDGVFSMEGTAAPLREIYQLAQGAGATLVIDESHATGVMGPNGSGTAPHLGLPNGSPGVVLTGSLSKALGGAGGGYVGGSREVIERLQAGCRSWIFTQGMTTANLASTLAALRRIRSDASLIERLWSNVHRLRDALQSRGVKVLPSDSAITAAVIGDEQRAKAASQVLAKAGIYAPSMVFPTVARGEARLRLQVSAAHTHEELDKAAGLISDVLARLDAAETSELLAKSQLGGHF